MNHEQLIAGLKHLRLPGILEHFLPLARESEKQNGTYEAFLAKLIEVELNSRLQRKVSKLIHSAQLPRKKLISEYDFSKCSGVTEKQIRRLAEGQFISQAENVVFYGYFGVGKSHLAEAIGLELCRKGIACLFISMATLVNEMLQAQHNLRLGNLYKRLDRFELIIIDELGYTVQSKEGADLFFELISQRYERKSLMITTNLPYSDWNKVFLNPTTTAAAVDRIIHRCQTFNIIGPSWRAEQAKKNKDTIPADSSNK